MNNHVVAELVGESPLRTNEIIPVISADGKTLEGAVTDLTFQPAITLNNRRLPAQFPPNRSAPPGARPIHRVYECSAARVTKLEVRVDLSEERVVEILPAGPRVEVTKMKLIGSLPKIYEPEFSD